MTYKKQRLIENISNNLAFSSTSAKFQNAVNLFSSNRVAQDFFCGLFNLVFGYNLKDLDVLNGVSNYPAIDLGDENNKIAIQITTQAGSQKIKDTIKTFIKHELHKKYPRLVFFIIGNKQARYSNFDTESKFIFNTKEDIWDDNFLIKKINNLDIETLEKISAFLEANLLELKFPETLYPDDIKKCIQILKRDFGCCKVLETELITNRGDDSFIKNIKNPANNVSWEFFKERIAGHIMYNRQILDFLSNEINKSIREDYLNVSREIHNFYIQNTDIFYSFELVFSEVFKKLNTYQDQLPGVDIKLKILLHNMYFNCDIGNNTLKNDQNN